MPGFQVHPDIHRAQTISKAVYLSTEIYEAAKEKIFAPSWQFVGDTDRVPAPGTAWPFTLLDGYVNEPLLLTHDTENRLHLLSNVCTHRGNLLTNTPCTTRQLRCKYHGRIFGLDGKFQFMPEFSDVENFPTEADHLTQLPLFQWGKLLFSALNPQISATAYFADMMERVSWMPLERMEFRPDLSKDYEVQANWALYCENYLEGFHIPFVHNNLSKVLDWSDYTTEIFQYSNLQLGIAKQDEGCFDLPPESPDYGKKVAAYYFWVFPNMMFNFYPWGLSLNLVLPQSVDRCKVRFLVFEWDAAKRNTGAGSGLDEVEMEDEAVVQQVQRGIRSRFYQHGRYAPQHEQGTHHFHQLLAHFLG